MKKIKEISLFVILVFLNFNSMAQIPTDSLVAFYPFNGNANDESGNGNNGTVNGAILTTDRFGSSNSAYSFNGINNWIDITDNAMLRPPHVSIAAWAYLNAANGNCNNPIFYKSQYEVYTLDAGIFQIKQNSGCLAYTGTGWENTDTCYPAVLSQWYFITGTFDGTTIKYYHNGNLISQSSNIPATTIDNCPGGIFRIGRWHELSSIFTNGKIDDIRIYQRALTQNEITALYNEGLCYQTISVTDTLFINANLTGFDPITYGSTIKIYPNPTNDHITIDAGDIADWNGYELKITNSIGQTMFQSAITQQLFFVDLSTWSGMGIYFVHIIDGQGNTIDIRKIVLQ